MSFIQGYQVGERLYESSNSLVIRATQDSDGLPVIIKILKNNYPTHSELARYRREFEITHDLELTGIIRSYELRRHEKTLLMVLEDFDGMSVSELMRDRPLSKGEFLDAAIQIAEAVMQMHENDIIHKDLNPTNLIINPGTGQVKIIDFGIATRFSREQPVLTSPEVVEGTLAYMSPEQTGRMNRSLDYRTDLYSLGATFYEMLTGFRPFDGDDDMELVHCQIAREPIPAHRRNPDVSLPLSKIVSKLMSKKAEDRYQSAAGLLADLEVVRGGEALERFEPGRSDFSGRFQIPERLYGREAEVNQLLEAFERTRNGQTEIMMVSGYSGVGKSALIHEIHKPITRARGYFISGKFDQFQRNDPYAGLLEAFRDLVRQLLTESEERLNSWRQDLNDVLAPNAQLILDVLPELALIIGPQPALPDLETTEATNRFNRTIGKLLHALCERDRVVVVFLDDLQWADSATLNLLETISKDDELGRLLLIGAYRDNEVDSLHPLSITLRKIREDDGNVSELTLTPLALTDIVNLLADTLHADRAKLTALARLVVQKTQGNPLFTRQFLLDLHHEGLIFLSAASASERAHWSWNLETIKSVDITDNVVDLLLRKLQRLTTKTQETLQLAACIGSQFDIETLALIQHSTIDQAFESLKTAIQNELIRPVSELAASDSDNILSPLVVHDFRFQHDRVQQAAYSLIAVDRQKEVHLAIGRRLQKTLSPEIVNERVFEVVDHLNFGRELIQDAEEKLALARLNLIAAQRASDATAYQSALSFVVVAQNLIGVDGWDKCYELTADIFHRRAALEYLNGNFDSCTEIVGITLEKSRTDLEKAEVYFTRIAQHTLLTEFQDALDSGRKALELLGIELPMNNIQSEGQQAIGKAAGMLEGCDIESLFNAPDIESAEMALAQRCLRHLTIAAFLSNQQLFPLIVGTSVSISLEHGNAPESALSYSNFGLILGAFMGRYQDGYEFGELAMRLCDRFQGHAPVATVCLVHGIELMPWVKHIRHSVPVIERGYQEGLNSGDILWAGYLVMYRVLLDTFSGKCIDDILDGMPDQLAFNARTQNPGASACILAYQISLSTLAGRSKSSADFAGVDVDEAAFLRTCEEHQIAMAICFYKIQKAQALFLFGRPQEALEATKEIEDKLSYIVNHPNLADRLLYQSLSLAALYNDTDDDDAKAAMDQLQANLEQLTVWSDSCPENYLAKRLLVEAEITRIRGDEVAAADLYDRAIDAAHDGQFLQDEALANELAARFSLALRPNSRVGAMYLRDARYAFNMWGATRKVEELELEFPQLLAEYRDGRVANQNTDATFRTLAPTTNQPAVPSLDLRTLIKAGQTISGEMVLGNLLDRLLSIVIENAGARRGVLLLNRQGGLVIEAEASVLSEDVSVLMSIPIDSTSGAALVPVGLIRFAERTKKLVVVEDAQKDERFMVDPYVQKNDSRSLFCQPILNQGQLIGLIYMENELISAAFTPEHTRLLSLLSGQIAISIKNAELVENLEEKVRERTEQLEIHTKFIEQTFGRYLSGEIADTLLSSADGLDFGGRKKVVTVMMSDLRGFSSFSDTLQPETIVKLLNNYLSTMTTIIQKYNGTIDEFIGDAILVIFGAPFQRTDDAERAVACALEMQLAMPRVNAWNEENKLPILEMGIGINTGEVVAGNIGSNKRAKYGVVGSNVNLAGRIEGFSTGGQILISKATRDAVKTPLSVIDLGTVEPKGTVYPVELYSVKGLGGQHDLKLPTQEIQWTDVDDGFSINFQILSGKMVTSEKQQGTIIRLSKGEAEIVSSSPPPPFTDVKIQLNQTDGNRSIPDLYGKVIGPVKSDQTFIVKFTALPEETKCYFLSIQAPESADV